MRVSAASKGERVVARASRLHSILYYVIVYFFFRENQQQQPFPFSIWHSSVTSSDIFSFWWWTRFAHEKRKNMRLIDHASNLIEQKTPLKAAARKRIERGRARKSATCNDRQLVRLIDQKSFPLLFLSRFVSHCIDFVAQLLPSALTTLAHRIAK